jgi:tetratricopeptide (TPR) repeat protein
VTADQWARVAATFDAVREHPDDRRSAYLDTHCPDTAMRAEVLAMLQAYDRDPAFLEPTTEIAGAVAHSLATGLVGRRVGTYRLIREIGRGGMGIVYEGHRDDEEFDRRVAVKVLPAWSAAPLVERFRFERRVLAGLDHPGIAKLLDAGTTGEGLPYFVMELVNGRPIDAWCRERQAPVPVRVELVERVCAALAYAHQNLVIHRDVKAANILVTTEGDPKLLDFGIAAMLADDGAASAGLTRTGHHSFTPEYASPEQIRGERVTTATDVYSLGVVLYRLLAERPPYQLAGLSTFDAMHAVCELEPPPMSAAADAARRDTLRGDLDRIVAKALRKSPQERYGTMAELAADLRAWREGRPVSAATQSVAYRVRRFARRNRGTVAAGLALVVALVAGATATAWQARVAARERDKAQNRFRQVQEFSRALLFDVHDALRTVPGTTEPRRLLLERGVRFLDGLAADAADDAALQEELATGYRRLGEVQGGAGTDNLGDGAAGLASLEKAARLIDQARLADPRSVGRLAKAVDIYGDLTLMFEGLDRRDDADRAATRQLALVAELERDHPGDATAMAKVAGGYSDAGLHRAQRNDYAGARRYYADAVRVFEALPPDARREQNLVRAYSLTLKRLGAVEMVMGALDESERRYRAALAIEEDAASRAGPGSRWPFEMSYTLSDLGLAASRRGNADEAMRLWTRALDLRRAALAADPKNVRRMSAVASILTRLGGLHSRAGRHPDAVAAFEEALRLQQAVAKAGGRVPDGVRDEAWALINLAAAQLDLAAATRSRADADAAHATFRRIRPDDVLDPASGKPLGAFRTEYDRLATRFAAR